MLQPKLPLGSGLLYECANPECFYVGALLRTTEIMWVTYWSHELEDLDLRATCPSCAEPMMIWHEDDDTDRAEDQQ